MNEYELFYPSSSYSDLTKLANEQNETIKIYIKNSHELGKNCLIAKLFFFMPARSSRYKVFC